MKRKTKKLNNQIPCFHKLFMLLGPGPLYVLFLPSEIFPPFWSSAYKPSVLGGGYLITQPHMFPLGRRNLALFSEEYHKKSIIPSCLSLLTHCSSEVSCDNTACWSPDEGNALDHAFL